MENINREIIACVTVQTPDGLLNRINIYEGEKIKDKISQFMNNWFKVTSKDPEKFGHKVISIYERACPKCGGELHYKEHENGRSVWCINCHKTFYESNEDNN